MKQAPLSDNLRFRASDGLKGTRAVYQTEPEQNN